jgi:glycosyltransferase involved in cell wall biosynthesis
MNRIGFDAKRFFYNTRGLGNYSRDTVRILSSLQPDNEYFLFTPKIKNALPVSVASNCQIIQPKDLFYKNFSSLWRTYEECREINRLKLDIFHGLSHELPMGIEKAATRSVVTMHDLIFLKFPQLYHPIDRELYKRKYLRSCKTADKIIAISEQTKRDLIEFTDLSEKKIEVVYQGCSPIFRQVASEEKLQHVKRKYHLPQNYLLNVGTVEKRKNQELIIQAMAYGKLDIPLVILGKQTEYINQLKILISKHKLESSVIFLTDVQTEDLPAIYQLSSIFVYPSLFEGFGIPILEALSSRVPVITSKGSCFEETGGKGSCYINHKDAEELTAAINDILGNPEKRQKMVEAGLIHANQFTDEHISHSLIAVYESLL